MEERVRQAITQLRLLRDMYYESAKTILGVAPANFYHTDFFYIGVLNRSYCLLRGFCDLLDSENFVSAVPLVRLQLDCCLRAAAPGIVANPAVFASAVLGGTLVKDLKDRDGQKLTDKRLLDLLITDYPWIQDVYREASGFVHFSDKHIFNSLRIESEQERSVRLKVSDRDEFVPAWAYMEAIDAFGKLSMIFLDHIGAYGDARHRWETEERGKP